MSEERYSRLKEITGQDIIPSYEPAGKHIAIGSVGSVKVPRDGNKHIEKERTLKITL